MGRQEKLFEWFKCLPAHKRIDYMCGLLRMCLPLELRFLGSVLENLARKDFHSLRDQENKANLRADLSANTSSGLSDRKLRAKVITALALMDSSNSPCAQVIFDLIWQQDLDSLLKLSHNSSIAADLMMMLTMAVNHPAFTFYQRNQLGQVFQRVQRYMGEPSGDDSGDAYTSTVPHGCCQSSSLQQQTVSEGDLPYCSCEPPQTSAASSPMNSRTSSPSSVSSHTDSSCRLAGMNPAAPPPADHTFQLLHVLSLDDYYSTLKDDPVQQMIDTNKEECAKAGLPPEVEVKLKSKLRQGRPPYMNGVADAVRLPWAPVLYQPLYHQPLAHIGHHCLPHLIHSPGYVPPSRHTSVPPGHTRPGQGSAGSSQTPSPPSSPQLPTDQSPHPAVHVPSTLDLHLMSPARTVAMDTQPISDVNMEGEESCSSEDEKPPGYHQTGQYKRPSTAQQSQSLPVISQDTVFPPSLEAAQRTSMLLPAPLTHPHLLAESGTRTPPLGLSAAGPHISTSHVGLVNGYLSKPAAVPGQGAPTVVGPRGILHSRTLAAAQPVHSGLHWHNQAMPLPGPDAQQWYGNLAKNGANHNSLSELPAGLPLPSYIPLASSTPMMILSPANFQLSNMVHLPPQSSATVIPQPVGMHTSIPNSSLVGSTPSHSTAVYVDQLQPSSYVIETADPSRAEESSVSPSAQTASIVTAIKSHSHAGSTSSGTPSPPLMPTSHKHTGPGDTQSNWRPSYMWGYINGYVPVIYSTVQQQQQQQQQQQPFPANGLMPEFGTFVRLPHHTPASHLYPPQTSTHTAVSPSYTPQTSTHTPTSHLYPPQTSTHTAVSPSYPPQTSTHTAVSPSYPPQTSTHTPASHLYPPQTSTHTAVSPSYPPQTSTHTAVSPSTTKQSSPATNSACYNCGYTGHQVSECQESRMETVSNTFHLKYNPRDPPT